MHADGAAVRPGSPLWGEQPRRQPVVPLVLLALLTLLVCAPAAMSGSGESANPLTLMRQTARSTYELAGLATESNKRLVQIDANSKGLADLAENMDTIATATDGMNDKTTTISQRLTEVGGLVSTQRGQLVEVDGKLEGMAAGMATKRKTVGGSLKSTKKIVGEFRHIDSSITSMDRELESVIGLMAESTPQTRAFAQNTTRLSIAGGDGHKYGVANIAAGSRVMSVMLPMIRTMQTGGKIPARKERAVASNPLIGTMLGRQVPDGTNVVAIVEPFDGRYGLPGPVWFVNTPVNGF